VTGCVMLERARKRASLTEEYERPQRGSKAAGPTFELRNFRVKFSICRLWAQQMFKWHCLQKLSVKCVGLYPASESVRHLEDRPTYSCLDYRIL
jgi:hypothetical protein